MGKQKKYTLLFIGWLMFVTWASLYSFPHDGKGFLRISIKVPHLDKLVHFVFYAVMAFLGVKALTELRNETSNLKKYVIFSLSFAIVYGILIEALQYTFTINRQGDPLDVLANTLGALCGTALVLWGCSGNRYRK